MDSLGKRISFYRRQRGFSQIDLAKIIGRSESWVSQVERGTRSIDRISVLMKLADALEVTLSSLKEMDLENGNTVTAPLYIDELRLALTGLSNMRAICPNPTLQPNLTSNNFTDEVNRVWTLVHESTYAEAAPLISTLLIDLEKSIRDTENNSELERLNKLLVSTYQAAASLLSKVGEEDSAWVASDRAVRVSEKITEDFLYSSLYRMAQTFLFMGRLTQAEYISNEAIEELMTKTFRPEVISLLGAFQLIAALIAADSGDSKRSRYHLEEADRLAKSLNEERNDFSTEFGSKNVLIHKVAVAVKLGNAGEALELASGFEVGHISKERYTQFLVDVARANLQLRRFSVALDTILMAEKQAPEQLTEDVEVRQIIKDLALVMVDKNPALEQIANRLSVSI